MAKKISTLSPGNLVKINESGNAIPYIFLQYNHYGKTEVTLIRRDPRDVISNLVSYNGIFYPETRFDDDPCDILHVLYENVFDPMIRGSMVSVPIKVNAPAKTSQASYVGTVNRKVFPLSLTEFGIASASSMTYPALGTAFSYFSSDANRIAYLLYDINANVPSRSAMNYMARTIALGGNPSVDNPHYYTFIGSDGKAASGFGFKYFRPAITLSSEIMVSDSAGSDGCYTIESCPAGELYHKVNGVWLKMV